MNKAGRNYLKQILFVLSVFLIVQLCALLFPDFFESLNRMTYNACFRLRYALLGREAVSPVLSTFNLDDAFEAKYKTPGREREVLAGVLRSLEESQGAVILLDIGFEERVDTHDGDLAEAFSSLGNVYSLLPLNKKGSGLPEGLPEKAVWSVTAKNQGTPHQVTAGKKLSPLLVEAARGVGSTTLFPDDDGIIRRLPLLYAYGDEYVPSLVLTGICHYYRVQPEDITITFGKHISLPRAALPGGERKDLLIPVDHQGQLLINFAGPWDDSFNSFSLENLVGHQTTKVTAGNLYLDGNFVLIGDITTGKKDITYGIFDRNYPSVSIINNALNTILTQNYLYKPGQNEMLIISCLLMIILVGLSYVQNKKMETWHFILAAVAYIVLNLLLFFLTGRLPDFSQHLISLVLAGGGILWLMIREIKGMMKADDHMAAPLSGNNAAPNNTPASPGEKDGDSKEQLTALLKPFKFTSSQIDVLIPLMGGKQYQEIAYELNISVPAVGRRINRIYLKMEVNNKVELINKIYGGQ